MHTPDWFKKVLAGDAAAAIVGTLGGTIGGGLLAHKLSEVDFGGLGFGKAFSKLNAAMKEHFEAQRKEVMDILVPMGASAQFIIALIAEAGPGPIVHHGASFNEHWIVSMLGQISRQSHETRVEIYSRLNGFLAAGDRPSFFAVLGGYYNDGVKQQFELLLQRLDPETHAFCGTLDGWTAEMNVSLSEFALRRAGRAHADANPGYCRLMGRHLARWLFGY